MNRVRILLLIATIALLMLVSIGLSYGQTPVAARPLHGFTTNEEVLAGLADRTLDLADSLEVFRRVIASLPDTATMMPSENYYYFAFHADGRRVTGSISLFPHERDSGVVGFGYTESRDNDLPLSLDRAGGWGSFGRAAGVTVTRIDSTKWRVEAGGRSVLFRVAARQERTAGQPPLRDGERLVLRMLDESGLPFALVLDSTERKVFWTLDESRAVPEHFEAIGEDLELGARTRFAFFRDTLLDRRVLVGVEGYNVLANTWYDGPFDQIPDNDIERGAVDFVGALAVAYPELRDRIDRFGKYHDNPATRVAIAPYLVYFSIDELLDNARICRRESPTPSSHTACLTQQVFIVPSDAYASTH